MVVGRQVKMSDKLYKILFLLTFFITVFGQNYLPQSDECGTLNTNYFYDQKNVTEIGEFPWMGRLQYRDKQNGKLWLKCYAVLINKWFLVRTAACLTDNQEPVNIILGDWNNNNSIEKSDCDDNGRCAPVPKLYKIKEVIIHPNNSRWKSENDIALVRLSEPVTYSDYIRPICLPSKDIIQKNFDNELLELTGWHDNISNKSKNIQAKSFVRVVNLDSCELFFKNFTFGNPKFFFKLDRENSICAFSCFGVNFNYFINSALMGTTEVDEVPVNYFLIGISVFRPKSCTFSAPHVYIRIDRYLDWIYDNINKEISIRTPRNSE